MRSALTLVFFLLCLGTKAQCLYFMTFDAGDTSYSGHLLVDSTNSSNLWEIGKPNKLVFDSAYSLDKAIVTDTIAPYSTNDTSSFIITVPSYKIINSVWCPIYMMTFWYQLDIDSGDYAIFELSDDTGQTWQNISGVFSDNSNNFTTSTPGWLYSYSDPLYSIQDTLDLLFRVSFISDSIISTKDGMIIDDICFTYWYPDAIPPLSNRYSATSVYPNPANSEVFLKMEGSVFNNLVVSNDIGQEIMCCPITGSEIKIDISQLPPGIYFLNLKGKNGQKMYRLTKI